MKSKTNFRCTAIFILCAGLVFPSLKLPAQASSADKPPGASAQQIAPALNLDSLKFLLGNWVGEGATGGESGAGYCSFEPGLQSKVIVRKNHAEYPAANNHPAVVHDDLMIIYPDPARHEIRAFYTDNEGHIINYTVTAGADGSSAVFLSDTDVGAPRYRLTYTTAQPEQVSLTFEIAPPGHPDQFHKYIQARLRKSTPTQP